jgi:hypothetical protein
MKYSDLFALFDDIDLESEVEELTEAVIGEYKPEQRSHVRAFDDLA